MKLITPMALAFTCLAQEVHDIRVVRNSEVDLTPIHDWMRTQKGKRPMEAWKQIQVLEVKGRYSVWPKCRILAEGKKMEVLLANAGNIESLLNRLTNCVAEAGYARNYLAAAEASVRRAERRAHDYNHIPGNPGYAWVPGAVYNNLDDAKAALSRLESEYASLCAAVPSATTDFAMFTSNRYGALQIWDLGKKK